MRVPVWNGTNCIPRKKIFIISILTLTALGQGREDIEEYAKAKKDWLRLFLNLKPLFTDISRKNKFAGGGKVY
jgi:hypothetical protein